jgi:hypothetical protein
LPRGAARNSADKYLVHLLLQALGLAHDNDPSSVMYPLSKWGEATPTKITGQDRVLLRFLYRRHSRARDAGS